MYLFSWRKSKDYLSLLPMSLLVFQGACTDGQDPGASPTTGVGVTESPVALFPAMVLTPEQLTFSNLALGGEETQTLQLSNDGAGTLVITLDLSDDGDGQFTLDYSESSVILEASEQASIDILFSPTVAGAASGTLTLTSNDEDNQEVSVPLSGTGVLADADQDGYTEDDCDDQNAEIYPGADESCDGLDNDCDNSTDEGLTEALYPDSDEDGYGALGDSTLACPQDGWTSDTGDCNDDDAAINPLAEESCDGLDNNCNDEIDEGVRSTFYPDVDGDGFGNTSLAVEACEQEDGQVGIPGDCNDDDGAIHPEAVEACDSIDSNCDGIVDDDVIEALYADQDGDGFGDSGSAITACPQDGYVSDDSDCNDSNNTVYPEASELCDGLDNDCDSSADEGVTDTFYVDEDGDGVGATGQVVESCSGEGQASVDGDCDDSAPTTYPGADELCDGLDNDCDTSTDEGLTGTFYQDADNDGFGDTNSVVEGCPSTGYVDNDGDCNDNDSAINPDAPESCDQVDNNCNGEVDEDLIQSYYADNDDDGYGDPQDSIQGCTTEGYVSNASDCDDNDSSISPSANEFCDELDNNCNGEVDEGVTNTYYSDFDEDGYGDADQTYQACEAPPDHVSNSTDCDDDNPDKNPSADELCDQDDNDCDGDVDEDGSEDAATWYQDDDGDSYGVEDKTVTACLRPSGYAALDGDCDDGAPTVNPGVDERCDDIDNNCDGEVDEDTAIDAGTYYPDGDEDGFGLSDEALTTCNQPDGYVDAGGDCDDDDTAYYPGALEDDCTDPNDYNCDGSTAYNDEDADGFPACEDCDDSNADVYSGATEICDELDNNCNGVIDEGVTTTFYLDYDDDGFGAAYNSKEACTVPEGYTASGGDCNDYNANISPGAPEQCDDIDNNCNGLADEGLEEVDVYPDLDGDNHGAAESRPLSTCLADEDGDGTGEAPPYGYALEDDDCDDSDVLIYEGAPERCDGEDNDCNGYEDEYCFGSCGGDWPFRLDYSYSSPQATFIDMNGDNSFETVIQDNFGFAILDESGSPLYNYSAAVHNYSRRQFVAADIDSYEQFTADTQNIEVLTGNGSHSRFYRMNGDKTITVIENTDVNVYDASEFLVADLDFDRSPEFLTSSWCEGAAGVKGFRYNKGTGAIDHLGNIPDPDATCVYTGGRTLTDLDGDGFPELLYGNGYGRNTSPNTWAGQIYAFDFLDTNLFSWGFHCDPENASCFPSDVEGLYSGSVTRLLKHPERISATSVYFSSNTPDINNPSTTLYWAYDGSGEVQENYPSSSENLLYPTDIDDDGVPEHRAEAYRTGLWDVNGDGFPDRIYSSGDEIRLALWDNTLKTFVEHEPSRQAVAGDNISVRSVWDSDGDGRLNVLVSDVGGDIHCYELGEDTWNKTSNLPAYRPTYLRTNQWDNYEPNEGADTTGDGIPDQVTPLASALTRYGNFYAHLSNADDVDSYQIDTGWGPNICLQSPPGRSYRLSVYSYRDRWNNETLEPTTDGIVDALVWSGETSDGGEVCFTSSSVTPARNGEYKFVAQIESSDGDSSAYWPYWITARK